jgi:spore maturation protein CgeB
VGYWGVGERTREIEQFLLRPASCARLPLDVYGVRYPEEALDLLADHDSLYRGWLPNAAVPSVYARHLATVHVPRSYYATILPGIPTIRVFEALACGIPLVCAPWEDSEGLFRPGEDFLTARDRAQMADRLIALKHDPGLRRSLVRKGLETILSRHTCGHRADELLAMVERLNPSPSRGEGGARSRNEWEGEGVSRVPPMPVASEPLPSPSQPSAEPLPLPLRERGLRESAA